MALTLDDFLKPNNLTIILNKTESNSIKQVNNQRCTATSSSTMLKKISTVHVGIVTYNSLADIPKCLGSLQKQTYPNLNIVILDNSSKDNTPHWIEKNYPDLHLIKNVSNEGFGRGHNRIIQAVNMMPSDWYLALNPDVHLLPEFISKLVASLGKNDAGWGSGKLKLRGQKELLYSTGHAMQRNGYVVNIGYRLPDYDQFDSPREIFGASGAAVLMSYDFVQALAQNGELFDADMFLYGEDTDLDWRARHAGWKCWYEPQAVAYHRGSSPSEVLRVHAVGNRYLSVIKNAHITTLLFYNLPLIILHCMLRLIITPRRGFQLISQLICLGPKMLKKRSRQMLTRREMRYWFQWSAQQPSSQPHTLWQRINNFWEWS